MFTTFRRQQKVSLKPPPFYGVPLYYYSKQEQKGYIILAPGSSSSKQLQKYDIASNKWTPFATYPDKLDLMCHVSCIDQDHDLLYVSHGFRYPFAIYNLRTNKWRVMSTNEKMAIKHNIAYTYGAVSCMLPNSELHLIIDKNLQNHHIRYDKSQQKFVSASKTSIENNLRLDTDAFLYVPGNNTMMILGGYSEKYIDKIWYTNYAANQQYFEWKEFPLRLPKPAACNAVVVFDLVLIAFLQNQTEKYKALWILDLGSNHREWTKSLLKDDQLPELAYIVATKSNHLHFIHGHKETQIHFKVSLSQIIPSNIYNKYVNNNRINVNIKEEAKCNECDELKDKLKIAEVEKQSLQSLVDDLLKNQNSSKQQHISEINKLKQNYQQQIDQLEIERDEYKNNENVLKEKLMQSRTENGKLMEECKETKLELNEMKNELDRVKRLKNIDTTRFLEWSSDEFVDWIITLEQDKFLKYENILRSAFNEEDIKGEAIPFIEKSEWKGWGISSYMDRTIIDKNIKNLVNTNDNNKQQNVNYNQNNNNNKNNNGFDEGSNITAYI